MRVPRILALLLTATSCLSGCCSFNGSIPSDQSWAVPPGVIQKGSVSQKGHVVHPGHVHQVQKGIVQKGIVQKGGHAKSVMHQNLWNQFEPAGCCAGTDPVLGSCDACGVCGGACQGHTPAQHLKHMLTCASGCGEIYWGEWISDPPDDCDPCDNWGNWVGPTDCSGPSCLDRLAAGWCNLYGHRKGGKGGKGHVGCASCGGKGSVGKGGCATCGGGHSDYYEYQGEVDQESGTLRDDAGEDEEVVPTPTIAASHQRELPARGQTGFSIRSARFTR